MAQRWTRLMMWSVAFRLENTPLGPITEEDFLRLYVSLLFALWLVQDATVVGQHLGNMGTSFSTNIICFQLSRLHFTPPQSSFRQTSYFDQTGGRESNRLGENGFEQRISLCAVVEARGKRWGVLLAGPISSCAITHIWVIDGTVHNVGAKAFWPRTKALRSVVFASEAADGLRRLSPALWTHASSSDRALCNNFTAPFEKVETVQHRWFPAHFGSVPLCGFRHSTSGRAALVWQATRMRADTRGCFAVNSAAPNVHVFLSVSSCIGFVTRVGGRGWVGTILLFPVCASRDSLVLRWKTRHCPLFPPRHVSPFPSVLFNAHTFEA